MCIMPLKWRFSLNMLDESVMLKGRHFFVSKQMSER